MNNRLLNSIRDLYEYGPSLALPLGAFLDLYYHPDDNHHEITYIRLLQEALKVCDKMTPEHTMYSYCQELAKKILQELPEDFRIERFIDNHQELFDEKFKDDIDYQNAQRDIGEIEYIYSNDPESIIFEKQYDYCKQHMNLVEDYIKKGGDK